MVGSHTKLLPFEVAQSVVAAIDSEPSVTPEVEAGRLAELLMVHYALDRNASEAEVKQWAVQQASLVKVFKAYPASMGKRVVDPVKGLPSRLKFRPRPADLVEALEVEKKRRDLVRANALWHLKERDDRIKLAETEATYAKNKMSPEERAAQVQALLKAKPIVEPTDPSSRPGQSPGHPPAGV